MRPHLPGKLAAAVADPANSATHPVTWRSDCVTMPEADEISLGKKADADVRKEHGIYQDPELQAMIRVVGVLKNQERFDIGLARSGDRQPRTCHRVFTSRPDNDTRIPDIVEPANNGEMPGRLAQHSPLGENAKAYLPLMNAGYPRGEPVPGRMSRIAE